MAEVAGERDEAVEGDEVQHSFTLPSTHPECASSLECPIRPEVDLRANAVRVDDATVVGMDERLRGQDVMSQAWRRTRIQSLASQIGRATGQAEDEVVIAVLAPRTDLRARDAWGACDPPPHLARHHSVAVAAGTLAGWDG